MLSTATFGPLASLQLQDFQAQHHSRTHISPAKQTHLSCPQGTEVTRPSQGQKCESRSKTGILQFLSVLFYRSSFQQCESQFGTILYKYRSKILLLPPKKPFSPCVAWERLVQTSEGILWFMHLSDSAAGWGLCWVCSALSTMVPQLGWVLYTAPFQASDSQTPWSLQLNQQENNCLYFYLAVFFGVNLQMKLVLTSRG